MGYERSENNESFDEPTKEAAGICGASQATSDAAKGTEPLNQKEMSAYNVTVRPREENALQIGAQNNDLWISEHDFELQYKDRFFGSGAEQKVYLHNDGKHVIKVNTGT